MIARRALASIENAEPLSPQRVVGLDASYSRRYGGVAVAALVDRSCRLLEYAVAVGEPSLPYIPGLLAFREAALFYTALLGLAGDYDAVMVDGHGVSHPRYAGIATHLGLALGKPSIGVAKRRLYGVERRRAQRCTEHPCVVGELRDPSNGRLLAYMVLSTQRCRSPIYVSPGAYISPSDALETTLALIRGSKLPCPTRHADTLSRRIARLLDSGTLRPVDIRRPRI